MGEYGEYNCKTLKTMPKNDFQQEQRKELARMYYMQGTPQKEIAEKVGISANTMSRWVREGGWDTRRAANTVTRAELVKKMLRDLDAKLDSGTYTADEIVKIANSIEKLDKQTNIITIIEVFTTFNNWLVSQMQINPELTPEVVKIINTYQNKFINERLNNENVKIEG